jgi:hypothetical protein
MPNWVYNSLTDVPKEVYEKYKSEENDFDFNKIIPEPEEITNTVVGSYSDIAKKVYTYKNLYNKDDAYLKYDSQNPLRDEVKSFADRNIENVSKLVMNNPDRSLNDLLGEDKNKWIKDHHDNYVSFFGTKLYNECSNDEMLAATDKYIDYQEDLFKQRKEWKSNNIISDSSEVYKKYDSLEDMGKKLVELKEKYGYDNWYEWRLRNWGTKWNAQEVNYEEEGGLLQFDTAWSIPYPILAKVAQDNPEVNIDGYSEEETGWYDKYRLADGKVYRDTTGEIDPKSETPVNSSFTYDEILDSYKRYRDRIDYVNSTLS